MQIYLYIIQIFLAVTLIMAILLQVKGGSGLGGIFGQAESVYRTKRGVEKTLFQMTIVLTVLFVIVSIISLKIGPA